MKSRHLASAAWPDVWSISTWSRGQWPIQLALPALVGTVYAAAVRPAIAMFLGSHTDLSAHHSAPDPWLYIALFVVGFWSARAVGRLVVSTRTRSLLMLAALVASILAWIALVPGLDGRELLRHPATLVGDHGYLVLPIFIGMLFWGGGSRLGGQLGNMLAEELRTALFRAWIGLVLTVALATVVHGSFGAAGIETAKTALPLALVSTLGATALFEMVVVRRQAVRLGTPVPGWNRWGRVFIGTAIGCLALYGLLLVLVGPRAMHAVLEGVHAAWMTVAGAAVWTMYGLAWVVWQFLKGFKDVFVEQDAQPLKLLLTPEPTQTMVPVGHDAVVRFETPETVAESARWFSVTILFAIASLLTALIVWRQMPTSPVSAGEDRERLFSRALLRDQLRNLFRRRSEQEADVVDLDIVPKDVREVMRYVEVLADRQQVPRRENETAQSFAARLGRSWSSAGPDLDAVRLEYERVRYGDLPGDDLAAVHHWHSIYQNVQQQGPGP